MKRLSTIFVFALLAGVLAVSGCSSVKRVEVEEKIDLSGRWNDTDSRMVAETLIKDCVSQGWQPMFTGQNGRPPVVIVGEIKNQSHEHINADVFTKSLERSLINSGKVKFVADKFERGGVREERMDQQENSSEATRKKLKNETGADFMLIGSINSVKDEVRGKYVILYQVNLELVNLESNEKVWLGTHELKKVVSKSKYSL